MSGTSESEHVITIFQSEPGPIQTYHAKDSFIITPLAKFYMEMGIKITNVSEVIQYVPGKGLLPFAKRVVQLRSEATDEGDHAKQLTAKLFGNAGEYIITRTCPRTCSSTCANKNLGYGKQAENVAKHRNNNLYTDFDDLLKDERSPFFKKSSEVLTEDGEVACYVTNLTKAVVKDDKPVHIGVAILQWSKLLFLR